MSLIDILLLLPLVIGLVRGLWKGLVHELMSLVALFVGIFLAYHYSDEAGLFLQQYIGTDGVALRILAYLLIFGGVMIAAFALSFLLTKALQFMALGMLNRALGGLFGASKALLIMLVLIYLLNPYIHSSENWAQGFEESSVYNQMETWSYRAGEWLTDIPADYSRDSIQINQ